MGLFRRVSDIISANLNDMMERYENPEKMLRQAVREMGEAIAVARKETAQAMASGKLVAKCLADHEWQARDWQERAEKAVRAGDDSLARKALARKQEYDKMVAALRDEVATADEAVRILRRQLEAMEAKLAEAKRRLGTYVARQKAAQVRARYRLTAGTAALDQGAFEKFDRLREKVERAEAEAEALRELDGDGTCAKPEAGLYGDDLAVDEELAALKKKFGERS
jgi:phage shock protein A